MDNETISFSNYYEEKECIDSSFIATWDSKRKFTDLEVTVTPFLESYGEGEEEQEKYDETTNKEESYTANFPSVTLSTQDFFGQEGEDYFTEEISITLLFRIPKNYPAKCCQYVRMKKSSNVLSDITTKIMKFANSKLRTKGKFVIFEILNQARFFLKEEASRNLDRKSPEVSVKEEDISDMFNKSKKKKKKKKKKVESSNEIKSNVIYTNDIWKPEVERIQDLEKQKRSTEILEVVSIPLQVKQFSRMKIQNLPPSDFTGFIHTSNSSNWFKYYSELHQECVEKKKYEAMGLEGSWNRHLFLEKETGKVKEKMLVHRMKNPTTFFRRWNHCSASQGSHVYIFGGENEKGLLNDFLRINVENLRVDVFRNLCEHSIRVSNIRWSTNTEFAQKHTQIPGMSRAEMKFVRGGLLILGSNTRWRSERNEALRVSGLGNFAGSDEMQFYFIDKVDSDRPVYGIYSSNDRYNQWLHPRLERHGSVGSVPVLQGFSATVFGHSDIWIFGGSRGGSCSNVLYAVEFKRGPNCVVCKKIVRKGEKMKRKKKRFEEDEEEEEDEVFHWPMGRTGHSAVSYYRRLYIFGGRNEKFENLNDLFMFDIDQEYWQEIHLGFVPPPLAHCGFFNVGSGGFSIFGGGLDGKKLSKVMYTFYFRENKWYVSNLNMKRAEENYQENKNVELDSSSLLERMGTMIANQVDLSQEMGKGRLVLGGKVGNGRVSSDVLLLVSPNDPGRPLVLLQYLEKQRKSKFLCDVVFRCKIQNEETEGEVEEEEDEIGEISAHLCVLLARCEKFCDFVLETGKKTTIESETRPGTQEDLYVVEVSDIGMEVLESWIKYLYTGSLSISGVERIKQFLEYVKKYSPEIHFPILSKLCSKQVRYLDSCQIILDQLTSDFSKLHSIEYEPETEDLPPPEFFNPRLDSDDDEPDFSAISEIPKKKTFGEEERKKEEYFADLKVTFSDGSCTLYHSLFLCRSTYFRAMLRSQFKESIDREIDFQEFNKEAVQDIIHYLYTDEFLMDRVNCVGVLIYSLQFEILEISNTCRRIVNEYLNNSNVVELLNLAELYCDKTLSWICERYIIRNYEDLSLTSEFNNLSNETRNKVFREFEKKSKQKKKRF